MSEAESIKQGAAREMAAAAMNDHPGLKRTEDARQAVGAVLQARGAMLDNPLDAGAYKAALDDLAKDPKHADHFEAPTAALEENSLEAMLRARSESMGFGLRPLPEGESQVIVAAPPPPIQPAPPTTAERIQGWVDARQSWGGQGLKPLG